MKHAVLLFFFLVLCAAPTQAQEAAVPAPEAAAVQNTGPFRESFLFTPLEISAILSATSGKIVGTSMLKADEETFVPPRRLISLAGVVFRKPGDWIVWINGQKMYPQQLLPEIVDIDVSRDIVHLKWFDLGMNKIINISLRPHQTYDIVTGLLLPGMPQ